MPNRYEMLKNAIFQLYSKEGRSKSYISRLLELNRKTLTEYINDVWKFPKAEPHRYMNPSTKKFYNKNKQRIKARLDSDVSVMDIAKELGCSVSLLNTLFGYDEVLRKAKDDYVNRIHEKHLAAVHEKMQASSYDYEIKDLPNETWREIMGYNGYYVSTMGRIKHYSKKYNSFHLVKPYPNVRTNRFYVRIGGKNIAVARIVAHTFIEGYSKERSTVNHIDGNVQNNRISNLEWVSQSDNNIHAQKNLPRKPFLDKKYRGKHFIYKEKYEFKTVKAFAKFIGKSPIQAARWLDEAKKHDIRFLN